MNKLTLNHDTGRHFVYFEIFISTKYGAKIPVKNIGINWLFKNVLTCAKDTISGVTFEKGYWSFNMISKKLSENNIQLERNRYNNTCKIRLPSQINLLNFGPLLGFPVNTIIPYRQTRGQPHPLTLT